MEQMIAARSHILKAGWVPMLLAALACLYFAAAFPVLDDYIQWTGANFLTGLLALFLMRTQVPGKTSTRFGWLALAGMVAVFFLPVKTVLYAALCCTLLFLYESGRGKISLLPALTLFFMAPVCQYFAHVFSFPVRLWLTGAAGSMLQALGKEVSITGNIISLDKNEFSVDPACMGLSMLVTSLLCGLIMIALSQKKQGKLLGAGWIVIYLVMIFFLNTLSNLARILLLVCFGLMPDQAMHEMMGIVCLLAYVLLPGAWLMNQMVKRLGKPPAAAVAIAVKRPAVQRLLFPLLLLPLFIAGVYRIATLSSLPATATLPVLTGYRSSWYDKDIIKLENDVALVYIKPLKGFAYTDHNPLICWTGSGYTFDRIAEASCGEAALFTGILKRENELLYTAWWYDNGSIATISQWTWRWQMLRGGNAFRMINVTAANPLALEKEISYLLANRKTMTGQKP